MRIMDPRMKRWRLPQTRAKATKKNAAVPAPSKKYPVKRATCVKVRCWTEEYHRESVRVLAAMIGPRAWAKTETMERIMRIRSRFQRDQFCHKC